MFFSLFMLKGLLMVSYIFSRIFFFFFFYWLLLVESSSSISSTLERLSYSASRYTSTQMEKGSLVLVANSLPFHTHSTV